MEERRRRWWSAPAPAEAAGEPAEAAASAARHDPGVAAALGGATAAGLWAARLWWRWPERSSRGDGRECTICFPAGDALLPLPRPPGACCCCSSGRRCAKLAAADWEGDGARAWLLLQPCLRSRYRLRLASSCPVSASEAEAQLSAMHGDAAAGCSGGRCTRTPAGAPAAAPAAGRGEMETTLAPSPSPPQSCSAAGSSSPLPLLPSPAHSFTGMCAGRPARPLPLCWLSGQPLLR